jgi:catechol 2,3-dioxygenase-like lactoylglutathione lyase family enzyme
VKKIAYLSALILIGTGLTRAQQPAITRPAITGISHVSLVAQSLSADEKFYEQMLGWSAAPSLESAQGLRFFGGPKQWIDVAPAASPSDPPFNHVAFATTNAAQMRNYLAAHGVAVPATLTRWKDGSLSFRVHDPEGNLVEFVQAGAHPQPMAANPRSISARIIHAGFVVHSAPVEDAFYRKLLGFRLYWTGGMKDGVTDFFSLQVPDGTDWIEYMLNVPANASHRQLGVENHFSLGVVDIQTVAKQLSARGWKPDAASHVQMGRDGKYQLNVYDPDQVRIEYMEFTPKQKPCCAPFTGPHPQP